MTGPDNAPATKALWTAPELIAAFGGPAQGTLPDIGGISIDSRNIAPGDLFIALKGPNFDGHDYVGAALATGAAAIVERVPPALDAAAPLILVRDTQMALENLGRASRRRSSARIVAITGSVGKTSTKEMLAAALGATALTHYSTGSLNNHWGVPLSLARMRRDAAYGVFELGMSHAGEIRTLTAQVHPHVAIVTAIAAAHLEFFASIEAIADAKAEIFEGVEPGGTALLNRDDKQFARLEAAARAAGVSHILGFGGTPDSWARLLAVEPDATGSVIEADIGGTRLHYRLGLAGTHMAMNSLAVLAAVAVLGGDLNMAAAALAELQPLAGRGKRSPVQLATGTATLIDESYNASPAAMRAALAVLAATPAGPGGRRIAVLGDMRELGDESSALHRALAPDIEAAAIDLVFTVGTHMRALWDALPFYLRGAHADAASDLLPTLQAALRSGDVVTVKGSLGTRMADIVKPLLQKPLPGQEPASC